MPILTSGSSTTVTLGDYDSITLQNRPGQQASITVAGTLVNGAHTGSRTYGPYNSGTSVSITATVGDLYYEVADGTNSYDAPEVAASRNAAIGRSLVIGLNQHPVSGGTGGVAGSALNNTWFMRQLVPARFNWVRPWIINTSGSRLGSMQMCSAVSETFADDSATNRYTPIIGGVSRTAYASGTVPGWVRNTFGGSDSSGTVPPQPMNWYARILCGDRTALNAIPRTDGGSGFIHMARIYIARGIYQIAGTAAQNETRNALMPNFVRQFALRAGADSVNTIASATPAGTANSSDHLNVRWEYGTDDNIGTALILGDSISTYSASVNSATGGDDWPSAAWYAAAPNVSPLSFAVGSSTVYQWRDRFDAIMAADVNQSIRYLMIPAQSPNFGITPEVVRGQWEHLDYILDQCAKRGIRVLMWTMYTFGASGDAANALARDNALRAAAAGRCTVVDINALFPAGSGTSHLLDAVHPTLACITVMRNAISAAIPAIL